MKHKIECTSIEVVICDDCEQRFCRGCDTETKTDFEEGVIRCGLCEVLNNQWTRLRKQEKERMLR